MNDEIKQRLTWVRMYQAVGDAGLVCRRCGISRPTLRKWVRRYEERGEEGLRSQSRRPKTSPNRKVTADHEQGILTLRRERRLGARRIQSELLRLHGIQLSLSTIQKVLQQRQVKPLSSARHPRHTQRYAQAIPGERIKMDTIKVAPGLYQYTAMDRYFELIHQTPFSEDVYSTFDAKREHEIQRKFDTQFRPKKVKRCL